MARKGKSKRGKRKPAKRPGPKNDSSGDWSDYLANGGLNILELIPIVGPLIAQLRGDPTEQHLSDIASTVQNLVPGLADHVDVLDRIRQIMEVTTEQHTQQQNEMLSRLDDIKELLSTYERPDLLGQLSAYSLFAEAVAQIKRLADQAESMAGSLRGIEENLRSIDLRGDNFPIHVHAYVKMLIEKYRDDKVPHYFTVFNQGSQWYPKFAELQRNDPLGPSYLGHKTDLDELCAFLAEEVRPRVGDKPVLHILMPTTGQLSLNEAVAFPEAMRPFLVDGQLGNAGAPLVYICVTEDTDKGCLRDIGVLKPREVWALHFGVGLPWLRMLTGVEFFYHSSEPRYFIDPSFRAPSTADLVLVGATYDYCGTEPPRTLGQRLQRPWQ